MSEQETIQLVRRNLEAFNAGYWGAFSADLTVDSVYEELATGRRLKGIEEILAVAKGCKAAFPDAKGTITNELASGNTAALEVTWEGTHSGDLVGCAVTCAKSAQVGRA